MGGMRPRWLRLGSTVGYEWNQMGSKGSSNSQLGRPCDIYILLAAGEGCCSADNVCGKLLAAGAMGVVSGGGQTTVEIEIFQRGQLPQGWREGDQPRVADGGVGQREALVNISFSPRLSNRHIHHPMPKANGVGCTPCIPPASLPLAVASCKGPPTMQLQTSIRMASCGCPPTRTSYSKFEA